MFLDTLNETFSHFREKVSAQLTCVSNTHMWTALTKKDEFTPVFSPPKHWESDPDETTIVRDCLSRQFQLSG